MSQSTISQDGQYMPSRNLMDCGSVGYDLKGAAAAAERGSGESIPDAQYLYALFLYTGSAGVARDRSTAEELFRLASAGGSKDASIVVSELANNSEEAMDDLLRLRLRGEQRDPEACEKLFSMYDNGTSEVSKSHAEAVRWYTVCAEDDDAEAQNVIGYMYLKGKGIPKDENKAVYWLQRSADSGNPTAMYRLAELYYQGTYDTEPDVKKAMDYYVRAAEAGSMDAQFAMGCFCSTPRTKYFDIKKGNAYFEKAAEQGHAEAQYQIGMSYANGDGVRRDPSLAMKWLEKSCENGYQQAMVDLANMSYEGRLLPKDDAKAAHWFTEAAERCNGYAQYALACMYGNGIYFDQSDEMAFKWFKEAAEASEVNSQYCLALFYRDGRYVEKDEEMAAVWFDQAADQGHPYAMADLGVMKVMGRGTEQNVEEGIELLNRSAEAGNPEAEFYLGKIYYDGEYVERDLGRSKKHFTKAAKLGDPDAAAMLEIMKKERRRR